MAYLASYVSASLGAGTGAYGLAFMVDYAATKTAILQEKLSRAPELTDLVIRESEKFAEAASKLDYQYGVAYLVMSGFLFASAAVSINSASNHSEKVKKIDSLPHS